MSNYDSRVYEGGGLGGISGTVASLPAGFVLGEQRWHDGILYRLVQNAATGTAVAPGQVAHAIPVGGTAYSVSVSGTASQTFGAMAGAVVCHHATAATGYYFWGVTRGYLASGLIATGTCLATGRAFYPAEGGSVTGITPNSTLVSGNVLGGVCLVGPTAGTVGVRQGSVYVQFE